MITPNRARASLCAFLIALCVAAGCSDSATDAAAIEAFWPQFQQTVKSGDVDAYIEFWTDDGIVMPPNAPLAIGKEQIRSWYQAVVEQVTLAYDIENQEVVVSGDVAISRGVFTGTLTMKDGGDQSPLAGKYMTFLRKQPDGRWKIYRDIWNFDGPAAD
jgi:uncharacterized protein (TIGR02246 family)